MSVFTIVAKKLADGKEVRQFIKENIDERFFKPRGGSEPRKSEEVLSTEVTDLGTQDAPRIALQDLEGRPFVTTMSDRTDAGRVLESVGGKPLSQPIRLTGGQGYMLENADELWASAKSVTPKMVEAGKQARKDAGGVDPVMMNWRMSPSGGDFAHMTGQTMLAYNAANMTKKVKKQLDKDIKELVPDWVGVDDPRSLEQFGQQADKTRKALMDLMDKRYRDKGGLSLPQARLAVADPKQLNAPDLGFQNVGVMDVNRGVISEGGNATYPSAIAGEGLGRLDTDATVIDMLPKLMDGRDTVHQARRALEMKPYTGVITEGMLRRLEDSGKKINSLAPVAATTAFAGSMLAPEQAEAGIAGLFSQAVRSAEKLTRNKPANAQSWFNELKKLGVKEEELNDMNFLNSFGNRQDVTKQEVQEFIYENNLLDNMGVSRYGYRYGDDEAAPHASYTLNRYVDDKTYGAQITTAPNPLRDKVDKLDSELYVAAGRFQNKHGRDGIVKIFDSLKNKTTREMKTLSRSADEIAKQMRDIPEDEPYALRMDGLNKKLEAIKQEYRKYDLQKRRLEREADGLLALASPSTLEMIDPDLGKMAYRLQDAQQDAKLHNFQVSSHWEEENPIVTQRFSEKLSGKFDDRGLPSTASVIEEIQSDMHQRGSRFGYMTNELDEALDEEYFDLNERAKELNQKIDDMRFEFFDDAYQVRTGVASDDTVAKHQAHNQQRDDALAELGRIDERLDEIQLIKNNAPQSDYAPMKKSWEALGAKQALIDAVQQGNNRLFLTSPQSQMDRYKGAVREFDKLEVEKKADGKGWYVFGENLETGNTFEKESATFEGLKKHIGKDAYDDIVLERQQTGKDDFMVVGNYRTGHESFEHMYGRVLPKKINALGKDYGVKLEPDTLYDDNGWRTYSGSSMEITEEMAKDIREKGLPLYNHPLAQIGVGGAAVAGGALYSPQGQAATVSDMAQQYGQLDQRKQQAEANKMALIKAESDRRRNMTRRQRRDNPPSEALRSHTMNQALKAPLAVGLGAIRGSAESLDYLFNPPKSQERIEMEKRLGIYVDPQDGHWLFRPPNIPQLVSPLTDIQVLDDKEADEAAKRFGSLFTPI